MEKVLSVVSLWWYCTGMCRRSQETVMGE